LGKLFDEKFSIGKGLKAVQNADWMQNKFSPKVIENIYFVN
jgi:hypothetical protein